MKKMKKLTLFWEQVAHNHGSVSGHSSNPRQERWKLSRHRSQHNNSPKSLQIEQTNENPSSSFSPFRLRSFSSFSGMAMILALPILAQKISYIALLRFKSPLVKPLIWILTFCILGGPMETKPQALIDASSLSWGLQLETNALNSSHVEILFWAHGWVPKQHINPPCAWIRVQDQTEKPGIRNDLIRLRKKKFSTSPATQAR